MKPNLLYLAIFCLCLISCQPQRQPITTIWPEITKETKPWTRWWWMGNAVNKPEIERQLKAMADAGFGGVEITPIYGAKDYEDQYIDFLSDQWMDILDFTIKKADELGMGVDMNLGTGWPFGGPQISPRLAASKLMFEKYELNAGQKITREIRVSDPKQNPEDVGLLALMAYFQDGSSMDLKAFLDDHNRLDWSATQDCKVVAAFNGKTRQQVKRAAPGGEGWSMDHFSRKALDTYLARFDTAFGKITSRPRAFFNDSYEVYGSSGTLNIFSAFQKRKGYDLKQHLQALMVEEDTDTVRRIKSDYREVFAGLLMDEFTFPWHNWSNTRGAMARNQAHGSPANIIDLYAAVDIPECETFGSSYFPIPGLRRDSADIRDVDPDPVMMKFATSASNVYGKPYTSSETFTWLAEHFKVSLSQCRPELEQVWLAGVNHVFYHGITYSPEVAGWPGWLFYASVQFGPANSFWPHVKGLNEYIARTQGILQQGHADSDVLVYWPIYDVWNDARRLDKQISIHNIDEWLHPTPFYHISQKLMKQGYLVDFATDKMLTGFQVENGHIQMNDKGGSYQTLIIPACELMPMKSLEAVIRMAEQGATVIFEALPKDVPGYSDLENRREKLRELLANIPVKEGRAQVGKGEIILSKEIEDALILNDIHGESLVQSGLKFIRRVIAGEKYYFLVNHTSRRIDEVLALNAISDAVLLMDPDNGAYGTVRPEKSGKQMKVRVQLEAGQSIIVRCTDREMAGLPEWQYIGEAQEQIALDGPWSLKFTDGGPELPEAQKLDRLISWTGLKDEKAAYYSGTGVYEYTLKLEEPIANEYVLDLGKVAESARVWVNGREVGILWSIPFKARIGRFLHPGDNRIKVEVCNLMANRIRYLDRQGVAWRNYHEINFVNIDYEPFDASGWAPMPSGLLGPVTITPCSYGE